MNKIHKSSLIVCILMIGLNFINLSIVIQVHDSVYCYKNIYNTFSSPNISVHLLRNTFK